MPKIEATHPHVNCGPGTCRLAPRVKDTDPVTPANPWVARTWNRAAVSGVWVMVKAMVRVVVGLALCAVAASACSDSEPAASAAASSTTASTVEPRQVEGAYAGAVAGSDSYIAVVVGPGDDALAYVCDGAWSVDFVDGPVAGDAATLQNDGGARLDAVFDERGVSGTFTRPDSEPLLFTAEPATEPAGLYRADESFADGDYVGGWVVLADGTQRGAVRRYETPLPEGSVDATLDLEDPTIEVPGGVLTAHYIAAIDDV